MTEPVLSIIVGNFYVLVRDGGRGVALKTPLRRKGDHWHIWTEHGWAELCPSDYGPGELTKVIKGVFAPWD